MRKVEAETPEPEVPLIRRVLDETSGNQVQAAERLGISRNKLRDRMTKFGILSSEDVAEPTTAHQA